MTSPASDPYEVGFAARASRQLDALPERTAVLVAEFIAHRLVSNPRRIGKPLSRELTGEWSARVGVHRVVYSIDEANHRIRVTRIGPRADVYRP